MSNRSWEDTGMHGNLFHVALVAAVLLVTMMTGAATGVSVGRLKCEMLTDPLGIDAARPRLSWVLESEGRDEVQTAHQVLVATSREGLARNHGHLWDSGKVASGESVQVEYAGKPLKTDMRCFWNVRVWDRDGKPSKWSPPALWTMGVLKPADWRAKWIGYVKPFPPKEPALTLDGAQWIWLNEGNPRERAPGGSRYFRRTFDLPAGKVRSAALRITVDDGYVLYVNGKEAFRRDAFRDMWRRADLIDVAKRLAPGPNVIAVGATNFDDSPAGLICRLQVTFSGGRTIEVVSDKQWRCSDKPADGWEGTGFAAKWQDPTEMGTVGDPPWGQIDYTDPQEWAQDAPSPILRKGFEVKKPIKWASVSVCGLGYYELHLNGAKVGDHVLDPPFTRYDKRCLYATYDVTRRLRRGENALGVMLGNGWYNQHSREEWNLGNAVWRDHPKLLLRLRIEYADGSSETVASDGTWRAAAGPYVHDGIRNGVEYDARLDIQGWDAPGLDDAGWAEAKVVEGPKGELRALQMPACKVTQTITPVKLTEPKPGVFVFDMGQNFAGWAQLRVAGPAGTKVTMRYGERLGKDGRVDQSKVKVFVYQGPFQTDAYTLKGRGREVFETRFAYHGFRWVEVTGFPGRPTLDSLRGRVVHTGFGPAGSFECSNKLLNDIQRLTLWAYRSNYVGYPTDCPQREKNGWTGDAQLACEQGLMNWDNAPAYEKWMNDFKDEQPAKGDLPGIVPTANWGYGIGPAWDSAYILIPWYLYQYRGDKHVLAEQYEGMKRYVEYLGTQAKDHIIDYGLSDWCPAKTETPASVTSTGYYYVDCVILSKAAGLLGRDADARRYADLAQEVRKAFNRAHYKGHGVYDAGEQCALACALYQGLTDEQDAVLAALVKNVEEHDWHLDVGILGAKYLFHALTDGGRIDMAYRIATQTTFPSYGDMVRHGATTLWEDWRGAESLNHVMFGDISAWFYKSLAGINLDPERPGFRHVVIRPLGTGFGYRVPGNGSETEVGDRKLEIASRAPRPDTRNPIRDLSWVRASHESPYGTIAVAWRITGQTLRLDVTVPANTTATVYVPTSAAASVKADGGRFLRAEAGAAVYEVGSGRYAFSAKR